MLHLEWNVKICFAKLQLIYNYYNSNLLAIALFCWISLWDLCLNAECNLQAFAFSKTIIKGGLLILQAGFDNGNTSQCSFLCQNANLTIKPILEDAIDQALHSLGVDIDGTSAIMLKRDPTYVSFEKWSETLKSLSETLGLEAIGVFHNYTNGTVLSSTSITLTTGTQSSSSLETTTTTNSKTTGTQSSSSLETTNTTTPKTTGTQSSSSLFLKNSDK